MALFGVFVLVLARFQLEEVHAISQVPQPVEISLEIAVNDGVLEHVLVSKLEVLATPPREIFLRDALAERSDHKRVKLRDHVLRCSPQIGPELDPQDYV